MCTQLRGGRQHAAATMNAALALVHRLGFAMRESGQALERVGCRLQGIYSYEEKREWAEQHALHM